MSIKRDPDDLPHGVIVGIDKADGMHILDHDEYEEAVDDDTVIYPEEHSEGAMTLNDVMPGYDPDE